MTWAGSGKIDGNSDFTALMAYALGMKSKIITGYKGTGDMNLAIQRGEVDGRVVSEESAALYGPSNGMRAVAVLARKRVEQFPDAPTLFEAADARRSTGTLDRLARRHRRARAIDAGHAGHARRTGSICCKRPWRTIIRDPAFIAEARKLNLSANHAGADEVRATVERAMTTLDRSGPRRDAQHRARALLSVRARKARRGQCSASSTISP